MPRDSILFTDGCRLDIYFDDSAESPRKWDNLGTMACFHRSHALGDENHGLKTDDFSSWDEMGEWIERKMDGAVVLPLYLYDHSGLRIKVGSFQGLLAQGHAEFDSGQIGFIFVTHERIKQEYGSLDTAEAIERATKVLRGEVETYDQHLSGDVYGFELVGPNCEHCNGEGEHLDSCWGFYGSDPIENGMVDHLDEKYRKELENEVG